LGSPTYKEPLLTYIVYRLDDSKDNISTCRRNLFFFTAISLIVLFIPLLSKSYVIKSDSLFWVDPFKHSILEAFCGLISIIVSLIIYWDYEVSGRKNAFFLVLGFFSMGIFDIFHAFSDYCHNLFVWFHSCNAFLGSIFFFGSIFFSTSLFSSIFFNDKIAKNVRPVWIRRFYVLFGIVLIIAFALLSIKFYSNVPDVLATKLPHHTHVTEAKGHFSDFIYGLNLTSSILFLISGLFFFKGFKSTNDMMYHIFGTSALLFFASEFSFTFSKLWDPTWWYWHIIKAIIYTGLLIGLAYGFNRTFYGLHESRRRLAELLETLEKRNVEIRTAYERLKETQRYLSESERLASIGKMAAGLAHEIRNPLGAISNSLGVLKRYSSLSRDDQELLDIIEKEAERLNKLVEDFLSFSKPPQLNREETHLHELIDNTISILRLDKKLMTGLTINKSFAPDVPNLMLDRNQIKQVLWNLFINAIQAMPDGGMLTIKTRYKAIEDEVELTVADTGTGMSDDLLSQVFQPFFSTKDKGLGLGLNIVHKLVKEHGGYIFISSKIGEGTQIQLNFPVKIEVPAVVEDKDVRYTGS
jgi:signal transduction histidine kinase